MEANAAIPNIDPTNNQIYRDYQVVSIKAAFSSKRLYQYGAMMFASNVFGTIFSYEYKPYGLANNIDDEFLTWAGTFTSIT